MADGELDVRRWLLLDAMGLTRPTSLTEEREQWRQLHQVWQRGVPDADQAHHLGYPERRWPPSRCAPAILLILVMDLGKAEGR